MHRDNTPASPQDTIQHTISRLALSFGITLAFVLLEAFAGFYANSLALLTDAAHNLTDAIALAMSWQALRLTMRPAHPGKTYGYHRAGILVALINSITLVLISAGIFFEAYRRFISPPRIESQILMGVGAVAFFINFGTAWLVKRGSDHDLNLRSAFLHLMGDVFSTLGATLAGVIIFFTGLNWLDPLVSILIGLLILWNAWGILRETIHILLESTPKDIDMSKMVCELLGVEGVHCVHDLHVWSLTQSLRALSAHVVIEDVPLSAGTAIKQQINGILNHHYGIAHTTLQLECSNCDPESLFCDLNGTLHPH